MTTAVHLGVTATWKWHLAYREGTCVGGELGRPDRCVL